jgi:hypothetical protein
LIVGLTGLLWRLRFARAVQRYEPAYPFLSALSWAISSHEDAVIEFATNNEPVPTPQEAFDQQIEHVKELLP